MLVKVLWQHRGVEKATWELEDTIRANYPFLFEDDGTLFNHLVVMTDACACNCVYVSEFRGQNSFKKGRM